MTTALTIVRALSTSNRITHWAFNESSRRDAEALARLRIASPDRRECRVTVDFDPAGSAALNRPVRELVTAERDRLRALLANVKGIMTMVRETATEAIHGDDVQCYAALGDICIATEPLLARIDAALVPVPVKETAA